jgi:hypothetical protein
MTTVVAADCGRRLTTTEPSDRLLPLRLSTVGARDKRYTA